MSRDNVRQLEVSNLRDIPAMLEQWAAWLRDGAEEQPVALLMVLVPPDDSTPELCVFGEDMSRAAVAGNLLAAANQHVRYEMEDAG